jgi:DNA invertase Pin-like site-specific DNA recombinase
VSDKIKPHHLERKAILYVRQSSAYQVQNNLESQKLQYAMRDRLCSLGWRDIEVVDEDLGRTASGTVTRAGFERMVAEVCLGHVGAVAAREVSRFCAQQSGMAKAGRSLSCGGHAVDRSRDGVHTAAKQ